LIFFGAKKLPELARGLGESLKEFKKATSPEGPPPPVSPTGPAVTPSAGRRCPSCQTSVQTDWAHCSQCGTALPGA